MNKITKLSTASFLLTSFSITALADNYNIGLSGAYGNFEASGSETKDGITKNKSGDSNFPFASIFVEYNKTMSKEWDVAFGLDYIPFSAEIDSRSQANSDRNGENVVTGNRSATIDLKNHLTAYIQPSYNLGSGLAVFGKAGFSHADLKISSSGLSSDGTLNNDDKLQGYLAGIGIQKNIDKTMFIRFEGNYTDYDTVTYTNSEGTRFTADPELWTAKISIGKIF
jgi:opacity protein-like surface antigen